MIEVNNISKSFDGKVILHNVSAKFYSGKTNLIIGQSGSGKTVLMKCIVGLMQPDKGQVIYDGRDITSMSASQIKELRNEIGMLFQGSALFDSETVLGNVMFPLRMFTPARCPCLGHHALRNQKRSVLSRDHTKHGKVIFSVLQTPVVPLHRSSCHLFICIINIPVFHLSLLLSAIIYGYLIIFAFLLQFLLPVF